MACRHDAAAAAGTGGGKARAGCGVAASNDSHAPGRLLAWLALCGVFLWLAGCASLPAGVVRAPSSAIAASEATLLGRIASQSQPDPELTGLRLLPTGPFALDTRLALLRHAQASIDVQYYVLQNDETGRVMLRALRDAALRGVRVRLLLDDLYTADTDGLLLALAGHDNVQVRLFNPFPAGRQGVLNRFVASAHDFSRVNRRMHNKLFIVDGAMAVLGGRNIADEYFMRHAQANFVDLDAFVTGALLPTLQQSFDDYWNSPVVYPLHAIVPPDATPALMRQRFDAAVADAQAPPPPPATDVLGYGPISDEIESGRLGLVWAFATAYADPPDRIKGQGASYANVPLEDVQSVRYSVVDMIRGARREVIVTSPYLIPGEHGMKLFAAQRERGVQFKLLTNSLASTDEPLVHIGYRKYRRDLLKMGVDIYELSPLRVKRSSRLGFLMPSLGRLHAKTVVVDRQRVFIGSMNFDPRSDKHNTELGMFVDSPEIAREMLRLTDLDKLQAAYRVRLKADGQTLEWLANDDDGEVSHDTEPDTDFLTRLWLEVLAPLAPEELL